MNEITSVEEWEACLRDSGEEAFFVFKHSTTCPISSRAKDRVDIFVDGAGEGLPEILLVKVIESRVLSNAIASGLGIVHQSPQLILVKDGKALWSKTHHLITDESIAEALGALG